MNIDVDQFQALLRLKEWTAVYAMLDDARSKAVEAEDLKNEVYWRSLALEKQRRYEEAIDLLRKNAQLFNSQSHVQHEIARNLLRLGREHEALDELAKAPFETEMDSFYGLAIDAKFVYLYLSAKEGDYSVKTRLSEIPDDYQHIYIDGTFLKKEHINGLLDR